MTKEGFIDIELWKDETAYDAISYYVKKYLEKHPTQIVVVSVGVSYTGCNFEDSNEIVYTHGNGDIEFLFDWWLEEPYLRIYGIAPLSEMKVSGGIYE